MSHARTQDQAQAGDQRHPGARRHAPSLAARQRTGWIPGEGMRGHRISVQLGKASLRAGGKGIHAIAESTVWQRNRPAGEAEMAGK